eukprot:2832648-Pleurochrysis_carterae.AAC.1
MLLITVFFTRPCVIVPVFVTSYPGYYSLLSRFCFPSIMRCAEVGVCCPTIQTYFRSGIVQKGVRLRH